jgi:hypothetical protein
MADMTASPTENRAPAPAPEAEAEGQASPGGMVTFNIGGVNVNMPADMDDEQRRIAISTFISSEEFSPYIDKKTGAPSRVRLAVGSGPEEDRLANLQQFYPDAIPYGEDNFVFTDPESGRIRLFNPSGMDMGDIAGAAREGAEFIGGALGGAAALVGGQLGPQIATPEELVTVPLAAGAGAATAASLFDVSAEFLMGRIDTRSPLERIGDIGLTFMLNAAGERGGQIVAGQMKNVAQGLKGRATTLVQKFRDLRIDPPAGAASSSHTIQTLEKALESSPFAADVMQKNAEKVLGQTRDAANSIIGKIGKPMTPQGVGETIRGGAVRAAERFQFKQEGAYQAAFDLIGKETPVHLDAVRGLRRSMEMQIRNAPRSLKGALGDAIEFLKNIELDALDNQGTITFQTLRDVRTMVGRDLATPMLVTSSGARNAAFKRIYGALTDDMKAAATITSEEAKRKLAVADRYTRAWMNTAATTLEKIGKFNTDEQVFRYAMAGTRDGGTVLARLRRQFAPEEWDTVAASALERMGLATPGAQDATGAAFSVNTFMTNWSRMSKEAKDALFGGTRYEKIRPDLDTLVEVMSSLKGAEKFANTSNTGRVMISWMTLQAVGGGLATYAITGGSETSGAAGAAAAIIAPRMAAKMITNPSFVKWLATPISQASRIPSHIGRLVAIANDNPDIAEGINGVLQQMATMQPRGGAQ